MKFTKMVSMITLGAFLAMAPYALACEGEACREESMDKAVAMPHTSGYVNNGVIQGWTNNSGFALSEGPGLRIAEGEGTHKIDGYSTGHVYGWGVSGSFGAAFTTSTMTTSASDMKGLEDPGREVKTGSICLFNFYKTSDNDIEYANGFVSGGINQYNGSTAFMGNSWTSAGNMSGGTYEAFSDDKAVDTKTKMVGKYSGHVYADDLDEDTAQVSVTGKTIGVGGTSTYAFDLGNVAVAGGITGSGSFSHHNGEEGCVTATGSGGIDSVAFANSKNGWAVANGSGGYEFNSQAENNAYGVGFVKTHNTAETFTTPNAVHQEARSTVFATSVSGSLN